MDEAAGTGGNGAAPEAVSHGICGACVGDVLELPVTDIYALTAVEADRLPFGVMELSAEGVVRTYNLAEAAMAGLDADEVIGRRFFGDVAPCTRETEVEERFRGLVDGGGGEADFTFVFRFRTGHRLVRIRMLVDPERDAHLLLVHDLDAADENRD